MKVRIEEFLSKDCIIVFDTNVFLNIYEYSPQVADSFIKISEQVISHMVLPNTVKREFEKNHKGCHGRQKGKFTNVPKKLKKYTTQIKDKIAIQFGILSSFQFPDIDEMHATFESKLKEIDEMFDEYVDEHNIFDEINLKFLDNDGVNGLIQNLIKNGKLLSGFTPDELYKICEEGEKRYNRLIPPGFEDKKDKNGIQMYNDLIIWKEVLKYCLEYKKDLIFVTDDVKMDWWEMNNTQRVAFHPALLKEFEDHTQQQMLGITSAELFSCLSEIFGLEVPTAIECILGYNIDNYIEGIIDHGVTDEIITKLSYTGERYIDISSLSNYNGSSFEIADEEDKIELSSYEYKGYSDGKAIYYITFDVRIKAYSRWSR